MTSHLLASAPQWWALPDSPWVDKIRHKVVKKLPEGQLQRRVPIELVTFGRSWLNGGMGYYLQLAQRHRSRPLAEAGAVDATRLASRRGPVKKYCAVVLGDYTTFEFVQFAERRDTYNLYSNAKWIGKIKDGEARPSMIGRTWWERLLATFTWIQQWEIWDEDRKWGTVEMKAPISSSDAATIITSGGLQLPLRLSYGSPKAEHDALDFRRNNQLDGEDLIIPYGTPDVDPAGMPLHFCTSIAFRLLLFTMDFSFQ